MTGMARRASDDILCSPPSNEGVVIRLSRDAPPQSDAYRAVMREDAGATTVSMFPNGWPGTGLLLLRSASGVLLVKQGLSGAHASVADPLGALAGASLIAGLWTPLAGTVALACEVRIAFTIAADLRNAILLGAIGAALAMLGPGSRSVDNLLFGRKRYDPQRR